MGLILIAADMPRQIVVINVQSLMALVSLAWFLTSAIVNYKGAMATRSREGSLSAWLITLFAANMLLCIAAMELLFSSL